MTATATTVRIPTPEELADRLNGIHILLTARKWERAAIVYAFTDVGGPRNSPHHTPAPPRMAIRVFAAQGYNGLHSVKAVQRYRRAWEWAMYKGIAGPAIPGEEVNLPDEADFPAWADMRHIAYAIPDVHPLRRPAGGSGRAGHYMSTLSSIRFSLGRLVANLTDSELDSEVGDILVGYADAIEEEARRLRAIGEGLNRTL